MSEPAERIRLDKWLWQARFFKTRSLSAKVVSGPGVRVNGQRVAKPATLIAPGDVLTFSQEKEVRVIKMLRSGHAARTGPRGADALRGSVSAASRKRRVIRAASAADSRARDARPSVIVAGWIKPGGEALD